MGLWLPYAWVRIPLPTLRFNNGVWPSGKACGNAWIDFHNMQVRVLLPPVYDPLAQVVEHLTFKIRSLIGKLISENIANSGKAKFTDMLIPSKRKENE